MIIMEKKNMTVLDKVMIGASIIKIVALTTALIATVKEYMDSEEEK